MTDALKSAEDDGAPRPNAAATTEWEIKRAEGIVALSVFTGMRQCAVALEAICAANDPILQSVLFSGLVVNYARAFEEVRDAKTGTVRRFTVKKLPRPFDKTLHATLLSLRNEQIAHLGHVLNDYSLTFMAATVKIETPQPDGTSTQEKIRCLVGTRARASVACGPATVDAHKHLLAHIRALEAEAGQRLARAIIEFDLASMNRLDKAKDGPEWATLKSQQFRRNGAGLAVANEQDLAFSLAKAPNALPLEFTVLHYHVLENDGAFTLEGPEVTESSN